METIRSVKPKAAQQKWKVLVVDEHAQRLLQAVLKTYDVLEENVTGAHLFAGCNSTWLLKCPKLLRNLVIESMAGQRSPQNLEAIYFLMPTNKNVDAIIRDFDRQSSGGTNVYLGAHLYFMDRTWLSSLCAVRVLREADLTCFAPLA